jgi:5-methylcytosine-specific restriction endonuclease McrA
MSKKLNATELQLALALARLTWGEDRDRVQITMTGLADMLSTTRTTAAHAVSRLEHYNLVVVRRTPGDRRGNVYRLIHQTPRWHAPAKVPELRVRVFRRDDHTCRYCGYRDPGGMTMDHVIPKLMGGPTIMPNLVTSCPHCNIKKAATPLGQFLRQHPGLLQDLGPVLEQAHQVQSPKRDRDSSSRGITGPLEGEKRKGWGREMPSAEEVLGRDGPFVCPIFERRCGLADELRRARDSGAVVV